MVSGNSPPNQRELRQWALLAATLVALAGLGIFAAQPKAAPRRNYESVTGISAQTCDTFPRHFPRSFGASRPRGVEGGYTWTGLGCCLHEVARCVQGPMRTCRVQYLLGGSRMVRLSWPMPHSQRFFQPLKGNILQIRLGVCLPPLSSFCYFLLLSRVFGNSTA